MYLRSIEEIKANETLVMNWQWLLREREALRLLARPTR